MELKALLKKTFEAGEEYGISGEFARYAPTFDEWYKENEMEFKNFSFNLPVSRCKYCERQLTAGQREFCNDRCNREYQAANR